jgi:HAD superfamily hydrolase (TIGR01509 family)
VPLAYLIDLYDTAIRGEWRIWRDVMAARIGVEPTLVDRAYSETRPARSVGAYADEEADIRAVLGVIGLADAPDEVVRDLASLEFELAATTPFVYPDTLPTVAKLGELGARVGLISNCSSSTRPVVERLGLDDAFDAVILSFEVGVRKPDPAIYTAALAALGDFDPRDAVFVDDQAAYCDGARSLGMDTRLIIRPEADPAEGFAADTNGHLVIESLSELLP